MKACLLAGSLNFDQISEMDQALTSMLEYTAQIMDEGGYIDPEIMRLEQFVYDASQPQGKRMVLVDIEPLGSEKVDVNKNSTEYRYPSALASTVIKLGANAINLAKKAGSGYNLTSLQKAARAIEALPEDDSLAIDEAKIAFVRALDSLGQS